MNNLLVINSSPNGDYSKSTGLTASLTEKLVGKLKDGSDALNIQVRDLGAQEVPHLNAVTLSGFFSDSSQHTPEQAVATQVSDDLIGELIAADTIIIGAAMHNYMITSGLKAYLDQVTRAGKTFNYTDKGPVGHLKNKKVIVIKTSGGDYSQAPMKDMDFLQPYLTFALGFIGLKDVTFINHGGAAMGAEIAAAVDARVEDEMNQLVEQLLDLETA